EIRSRFDGATHTSPIETLVSCSNWCSKVVPLLTVLSRPPEALATQYVVGSASKTLTAVIRPPIDAGPMQRHESAETQESGKAPLGPVGSAGLASDFRSVSCFCSD